MKAKPESIVLVIHGIATPYLQSNGPNDGLPKDVKKRDVGVPMALLVLGRDGKLSFPERRRVCHLSERAESKASSVNSFVSDWYGWNLDWERFEVLHDDGALTVYGYSLGHLANADLQRLLRQAQGGRAFMGESTVVPMQLRTPGGEEPLFLGQLRDPSSQKAYKSWFSTYQSKLTPKGALLHLQATKPNGWLEKAIGHLDQPGAQNKNAARFALQRAAEQYQGAERDIVESARKALNL